VSGLTVRLAVLVIALSAPLACTTGGTGTPITGTATINGQINGQAFAAADANSATAMVPIPGTSTSANSGLVTIASASGLCQDANANLEPKSTKYLFLAFTDQDPTTTQTSPPTAPGVYSIFTGTQSSKLALAIYAQSDANCRAVLGAAENATDGTITLTSVSGGSYSGTFDLMMAGSGAAPADHITGQFSAPYCQASALFANQNRTTTCF
jgi:hypothetical protein